MVKERDLLIVIKLFILVKAISAAGVAPKVVPPPPSLSQGSPLLAGCNGHEVAHGSQVDHNCNGYHQDGSAGVAPRVTSQRAYARRASNWIATATSKVHPHGGIDVGISPSQLTHGVANNLGSGLPHGNRFATHGPHAADLGSEHAPSLRAGCNEIGRAHV